jgi:AraC-like DNA-binding protein
MTLYVKYDLNITCDILLREMLDKLGVNYRLHGIGEIEIREHINGEVREELTRSFERYGIEILDDQRTALIQRIKNAVDEMLEDDTARSQKISVYLADRLKYSYAHLSNLFSEATHTSIENYLILRKVDHAKELMAQTDLTLTEIAHRLHYSSVAHLSGQFKKTTGITPTTFQNIMKRRKLNSELAR